jgi:glycosyltransferase involved in cell wall biosynthesis
VRRTELPDVFARHDVLVLPSVEDGFGAVLCEAMAAGLPVIASANSGGPDVIVEGETGFVVCARSAEALAHALATLAGERERCEAMGRRAAAAMRAAGGWPGFVDTMLAQYEHAHARQGAMACAS